MRQADRREYAVRRQATEETWVRSESVGWSPGRGTLLAIGRRPLSRAFKIAVVAGIAVNAFGAVTFKRFNQFYSSEFFP